MTSKSNAVVVCDDISKTFRRKSGNVLALDSVSLSISPSEFVAIRGKSGCGKSTLMLCLGGLQKPDEGQVVIQGKAIYDLSAEARAAFRAKNIGYVFQQFHLIPYLTVMENVMAARLGISANANMTDAQTRAGELIEQVGLSHRADHKPAELSIGECQRVAIARALMNAPQLILADEPTGNLDEENTATVLGTLREIANEGTSVLMVTHDAQCEPFVDKTIYLDAGRVVEGQVTH